MKILIALDASAPSDRALEFVTRLRWPAGSRVIALTVITPITEMLGSPMEPVAVPAGWVEEQERIARASLDAACQTLQSDGFATESRLEFGDPRDVITRIAREERVDVLVVGSHGRTGLARVLLGSVSNHVVGHAPCSVLVVKDPAPRPAARTEK